MKKIKTELITQSVLDLINETESSFDESNSKGSNNFKRFIKSEGFECFKRMLKELIPLPDTTGFVRFKDVFVFTKKGAFPLLTAVSIIESYRNALKYMLFYYGNPSGIERDLISYRLGLTYMLDGSVSFEDMRSMAYEVHKELESGDGSIRLRSGKKIDLYAYRYARKEPFKLTDDIFIKELEECGFKPTYAEFAESITKNHFGECFKIFKPDMVRKRAKKLGLQDRFRDPRRKRETSPFLEDKLD